MKKIYSFIVAVVMLLSLSVNAQWHYVGQPGFSVNGASNITAYTDTSGGIYVTYLDQFYQAMSIAKSNGGAWQLLGSAGSFPVPGYDPAFAVSNSGSVYAAFESDTVVIEKYNYNNAQWQRIDSGIIGKKLSMGSSITTDVAGNLYATFITDAAQQLYIEKYNGTSWIFVDSIGFPLGYQVFTDKTSGHPYLGIYDYDVYVWDLSAHNLINAINGSSGKVVFQADSERIYWAEIDDLNDFSAKVFYVDTTSITGNYLGQTGTPYVKDISLALGLHDSVYLVYTTNSDSSFIIKHTATGNQNWAPVNFPSAKEPTGSMSLVVDNYGTFYVAFADPAYAGQISVMSNVCVPDVPMLTANRPAICPGSSATLQVSGGNLNSGTAWQWYAGAGAADSMGTGQSIQVQPDSTTTYYARGIGGCATRNRFAFVTVTVDTLVNAAVSIVSGADSICAGSPVTFTAQPLNGGNAQYQWMRNGTVVGRNSAQLIITTLADGDSITCRMMSGLCAVSDTVTSNAVTMHVTPYPSAAVTTNGPLVFCLGDSVMLTTGAGNYTYNWSTGSTTQVITENSSGTYHVTVTQNGCSSTDSVSLTASAALLQPVITPGTLLHVCAGNVTLDAGTGYSTYLWSTGDTTQRITTGSAGVYSVSVTQFTCHGTTHDTIITGAYQIPVSIMPQSPVIYVCSGDSVQLDVNTGYSNYQWSNGNTTAAAVIYNTGLVSVTVSQFGCTGIGSRQVQLVSVPLPTISLSDSLLTVCRGAPITLTVDSVYHSYAWGNGATTRSINVTESGTYSVTVSLNTCAATGSAYVGYSVGTPVNLMVDSTWIYPGSTIYTALPAGAYSYLWQVTSDVNTLSGVLNIITDVDTIHAHCYFYIDVSVLLQYLRVITTQTNGCMDTSAWYFNNNCAGSIKDIELSNSITLYPNPATDQLFIKTENIQPQSLTLYDVDGRMIFTQPFTPELNITPLSTGVYFIEVNSKEGIARKRFVKM